MALLSGLAGVYTESVMKKRPSRNINVQNFWLYFFRVIFNAFYIQYSDSVVNKGFFYGYSFYSSQPRTKRNFGDYGNEVCWQYCEAVFSTSVAMLFLGVVSFFFFDFHLSLSFILGTALVMASIYLHHFGKQR